MLARAITVLLLIEAVRIKNECFRNIVADVSVRVLFEEFLQIILEVKRYCSSTVKLVLVLYTRPLNGYLPTILDFFLITA